MTTRAMVELERCPRPDCGGNLRVEDEELKCLLCSRVAKNGKGELSRCLTEFFLLLYTPNLRVELSEHREYRR